MTSEEYWIKNKTKLQLNERSYNAFEMGVKFCENNIVDIKANCDLAIEGRDIKIKELEKQVKDLEWQLQEVVKDNDYYQKENNKLLDVINNQDVKIADLEKLCKDLTDKFECQVKQIMKFAKKKSCTS